MPACATPELFASATFNELAPRYHRDIQAEQLNTSTDPSMNLHIDEVSDLHRPSNLNIPL